MKGYGYEVGHKFLERGAGLGRWRKGGDVATNVQNFYNS